MAALFSFGRPRTESPAGANTLAFRRETRAEMSRPPLTLHWLQDAEGRLHAHWDMALATQAGVQPSCAA